MKRLVLFILLVSSSTSCVAAIVAGALVYSSSKSKEQHQMFMSQLDQTNMERESKGLAPLDWCSQAYRFDKGWAMKDANCQRRIEKYEKGDADALNPPVILPIMADSTAVADTTAPPPKP